MLQSGRDPRQIEMCQHAGGLEVVSLLPDPRQAQHRELAGAEALLEHLKLGALDLTVGDVRLEAVALAQRLGELTQAPHALGEHQDLVLGGDPCKGLRDDPAQERQPVPTAAHRPLYEPLAPQCLGQRGL